MVYYYDFSWSYYTRTCLRSLYSKVGSFPYMTYFTIHLAAAALHYDTAANHKRIKLFWGAFTGMFVYEIIPAYIFPVLNGFNVFCLASRHASSRTQDVFTNLFGGANANEGLGFLSLSFDWQYIQSTCGVFATYSYAVWSVDRSFYYYSYMSLPLIQQGSFATFVSLNPIHLPNSKLLGRLCILLSHNFGHLLFQYMECRWSLFPSLSKRADVKWTQSMSFPILSTSIFSSNGSIYDQSAVFGSTFRLNQTALDEVGLPALTGSNAWANLTANLSVCRSHYALPLKLIMYLKDWCLDCTLYPFLGAVCQGFVQAGVGEDTTWSPLEGMLENKTKKSDNAFSHHDLGNAKVQGSSLVVVCHPFDALLPCWYAH